MGAVYLDEGPIHFALRPNRKVKRKADVQMPRLIMWHELSRMNTQKILACFIFYALGWMLRSVSLYFCIFCSILLLWKRNKRKRFQWKNHYIYIWRIYVLKYIEFFCVCVCMYLCVKHTVVWKRKYAWFQFYVLHRINIDFFNVKPSVSLLIEIQNYADTFTSLWLHMWVWFFFFEILKKSSHSCSTVILHA